MKEKIFNKKEKLYFFTIVIFIIFICGFIIASSLKANLEYARAISLKAPTPISERANYYSRLFSIFTKAINLERDNSDYYAKKAGYILEAIENGLGEELFISGEDARVLYEKAITLNPANFEYHLKLGWFYIDKNTGRAFEEISKAVSLYPTNYQIYTYLAEYYLMQGDSIKAFNNAILSFYFSGYKWWKVAQQLGDNIKGFPDLSLNNGVRQFKLIIDCNASKLNFKDKGFMHVRIPLEIKAYVVDPQTKVAIYQGKSFYGDFKKAGVKQEYTIFEFNLGYFPEGAYLDDFEIKTEDYSIIEKVEIIKHF